MKVKALLLLFFHQIIHFQLPPTYRNWATHLL